MTKKPLTSDELRKLVVGLNRLARNLWWTWGQEAQEIFQELSPRGWQNLYHNAVAILHEVSDYELRVRLQDPDFCERVCEVLRIFDAYMNEQHTWAHEHAPALRTRPVAYFSAEFGFHETLPIAAGGLGILAGDHAKSASDLGIGFVGISLFYREGYFQQAIDADNWQTEYYTLLNPKNLPVEPVLDQKGEPLVCRVDIGMNQVAFQVWRANVGRAAVYLLDANRPENEQHFRDLTLRVYGGDSTTRVMQEMLLGIGGVRLLRALGVQPSVFHMNEGHAAFLALELIREKMAAGKNLRGRAEPDEGGVHFHDAHAGRGGPRPFQPGPDGLRDAPVPNANTRSLPGVDETGPGESAEFTGAFLHDRAGAEVLARRQRGQRTAWAGEPAYVALPVPRPTGGAGADRPYHQRHSPAGLDEGHGSPFLEAQAEQQQRCSCWFPRAGD